MLRILMIILLLVGLPVVCATTAMGSMHAAAAEQPVEPPSSDDAPEEHFTVDTACGVIPRSQRWHVYSLDMLHCTDVTHVLLRPPNI